MINMSVENVVIPTIEAKKILDQYFTVLSVELGNTTIKSVIMTTNVKTNENFQVNKLVRLTRDIRSPRPDEEIFGHTIWNKPLSKQAIKEAITSIILDSLRQVGLSVDDIDFVVRSTGVVAISNLSKETGSIIKALSEGCLEAGIKPSRMMAPFSIDNIPKHIRKYSFFNTIEFDGSVVSVKPPSKTGLIANQMESELVTAGIKLASKNSLIDYRNPVVSIDMGTTLAGQVVDNTKPYAKLLCNYVGLAGGISDVMLRMSNLINQNQSTIDLEIHQSNDQLNTELLSKNTLKLHKSIDIMEVPSGCEEFGSVAVSSTLKNDKDLHVIGSRINDTQRLADTFCDIINDYSENEIFCQIDDFYAYLIKRLINTTNDLKLITNDMTLGITGRAGITGHKPEFISRYLEDDFNDIIFMKDGLALGALMMARCMNSLGSPTNPIGGSKSGMCIMQQRRSIHKK